jgi:hypothetical protein
VSRDRPQRQPVTPPGTLTQRRALGGPSRNPLREGLVVTVLGLAFPRPKVTSASRRSGSPRARAETADELAVLVELLTEANSTAPRLGPGEGTARRNVFFRYDTH